MNTSMTTTMGISAALMMTLSAPAFSQDNFKRQTVELLQRGIAQGDTAFIKEVVDPGYIQHNPAAPDGLEGLLGFVGYLQTLEEKITVTPGRVLQDGNLVLVHSEYSMNGPKAVFDLFRVADGKLIEHWDAMQDIPEKTASGRSMTDGATDITDLDKTEKNRKLVTDFVTDILMNGEGSKLPDYIGEVYHQHNPNVADGLEGLGNFMGYLAENNISFGYTKIHNVVAEGNFVFTQSEGDFGGKPTAYYDLFRVQDGLIVEHWDVIQEIPAEFAHDNGMF